MKIIELLNKIANGEELPKKIRFDNIEWNRVYGEKNMCYIDEYDNDFFLHFFRNNLDFTLNDEVEIIEEVNKIQRIGANNYEWNYKYPKNTPQEVVDNLELVRQKINEIIDYINKEK